MSNVESSQDIKDSFCIYPFVEMNVMPSETVKPCCTYSQPLVLDNRPMSVYEHTAEEIWNSDEMQNIRRSMIEGKPVEGCKYCYEQERLGVRSMWTEGTENWESGGILNPEKDTIEQLKERVRANNFKVASSPEWFALDMGNQCNLKCRMCIPEYSSGIARDPIHSRWTGLPELPAHWQGNGLVIAPRPVLGILYEGFNEAVPTGRFYRSWTDGNAAVRLKAQDLDVDRLAIRFAAERPANYPVTITANGKVIFCGPIPSEAEFDAPSLKEGDELEIRIQSPPIPHPETGQPVGVGVEEIKLIRSSTSRSNTVALSRFPSGKQWFQETDFLIDELLAQPNQVRMINFIGGEPLLIKEVRHIMRYLIDSGVAGNVLLSISTNGTCADDEWFDLASKFKTVSVQLSVEGSGKINEYIRFPSKWQLIEENAVRFKSQSNTYCYVNMTVQAYNVLNIIEVVEFCDRLDIGFQGHLLQKPEYLSPYLLPLDIRRTAAERLRVFATKRDSISSLQQHSQRVTSGVLLSLASALEGGPQTTDKDQLEQFMRFTNDLDITRGQSLTKALPELHSLLEQAGYPWIGDREYA